ncbi:hypothetical protein OR1_00301 [Geobacter sp. OR-1]|uniref:hypothetical protein n=1 Tax=Geobacter sp. OR-1 TaxID=1266765 RepID=UPI00054340CA|nr:hypothetical protein [Geobacter sp. OR-1]GAM08031.1 hypothetical protein OR1_00301 [Geobacter sp. OR-1]
MKRLLQTILTAASSRALPPLVVGFFFLVYIGIAFFTNETLITLMAFTRNSLILDGILALIPLNSALRILQETCWHLKKRRVLNGKTSDVKPALFDESVELTAAPSFSDLQSRLGAVGYKTRRSENAVTAWRGASIFPARILFLAGTFCLFTGILISITTRTSHRQMVVEGEPLPVPEGIGGRVERITLANSSGPILRKTLTMEVAPSSSGYGKRVFGIYPPSMYGGSFVYPRYLGLALLLRFSAPDLPAGIEKHSILNCYPPGKEASEEIPGSPYRIVFSIPEPVAGSDRYISYMTGNVTLKFKLLKGKEVLFSGSAPGGGEFVRDGYRLAFPDIRRLVVTDYIGDYGVFFIWVAALLFIGAGCIWLPVRLFFPRREMLFRYDQGVATACSLAEGGARTHAGVFHEMLDMIDARRGEASVV